MVRTVRSHSSVWKTLAKVKQLVTSQNLGEGGPVCDHLSRKVTNARANWLIKAPTFRLRRVPIVPNCVVTERALCCTCRPRPHCPRPLRPSTSPGLPQLGEVNLLGCQSQDCPQARDASRIRQTPKLSRIFVKCQQLMQEVFRTHRKMFLGRRVLLLMSFRVGLFSFIIL